MTKLVRKSVQKTKFYCMDTAKKGSASISISGKTIGGVWGHGDAKVTWKDILSLDIYWWDCYSASEEAGFFATDWGKYGWSAGGTSYEKWAMPPIISLGRDPYHLDMTALIMYDFCENGLRQVDMKNANSLEWTWNGKAIMWGGPVSY